MVTGEPGPIAVCSLQCFVVTSTQKLNLNVREREGEEGMGVTDGGGEILAQNDTFFLIQT